MNNYKQIVDFLARLRGNNCKEWMDANRKEYKQIRADYEVFVAELIEAIGRLDSSISSVRVKDSVFRLNRNLRFSSDKRPYKTHFGVFISIEGKNSGYCGYYLHIEPEGGNSDKYLSFGGSMLAVGAYAPLPVVLKSIREEILVSGAEIERIIKSANGFSLSIDEDCLKRTPQGFPTGTPYDYLLRMKRLTITKPLSPDYFDCENLAEKIAEEFRPTVPLVDIVNRAIRYAHDEMM